MPGRALLPSSSPMGPQGGVYVKSTLVISSPHRDRRILEATFGSPLPSSWRTLCYIQGRIKWLQEFQRNLLFFFFPIPSLFSFSSLLTIPTISYHPYCFLHRFLGCKNVIIFSFRFPRYVKTSNYGLCWDHKFYFQPRGTSDTVGNWFHKRFMIHTGSVELHLRRLIWQFWCW